MIDLMPSIIPIYNFSYEFIFLYAKICEDYKKTSFYKNRSTIVYTKKDISLVKTKLENELKNSYEIFEKEWKKFEWKNFPYEEKLIKNSGYIITTNYDNILPKNENIIKLHGDIKNLNIDWEDIVKRKKLDLNLRKMYQFRTATFYGFSGDLDNHIITFINGFPNIQYIYVIDSLDTSNQYHYFLKWLKWKHVFPNKNVFIYSMEEIKNKYKIDDFYS